MGQDKAMLPIDGEPLLVRTVRLAALALTRDGGTADVRVIGRERPDDWPLRNTSFLLDPEDRKGEGPLGGILTALEWSAATADAALVVGCDMPGLTVEALSWLIDAWQTLESHSYGVLAVDASGKWHPLFAIYAQECLPLFRDAWQANERAMKRVIPNIRLSLLPLPDSLADAVRNVNTPDDLQHWRNDSKERGS